MSKEIQVKIKNEKAMLFTPYNMDFVKIWMLQEPS